MQTIETYKSAILTFGAEAQLNQLVEEMAELICAIRHHLRGRIHNIPEEIADVEIMLAQARMLVGDGPVDRAKAEKLERLRQRIADRALAGVVPVGVFGGRS
jgi:NTP pyrophosphatase (non-canonical NTP hydrolase)